MNPVSTTSITRLREAIGFIKNQPVIIVHSITPEQWPQWRELRLAALADAPEAFSSQLADWQGEGDTESRWRRRLEGDSLNLIAEVGGKPSGMVSGLVTDQPSTIELISLWVAPFARGFGVADALLENVIAWAVKRDAREVMLQFAENNQAAERLYLRHGFIPDSRQEASADSRCARKMFLTLKP